MVHVHLYVGGLDPIASGYFILAIWNSHSFLNISPESAIYNALYSVA